MIKYTKIDLFKRLKEEGFTHTQQNFLYKYEKTGQLKVRRDPMNGWRIFTSEDIEGIIDAVKRDGKDFRWEYTE